MFAQQAMVDNMRLLGRWSQDSLPVNSGVRFNDIWGYADSLTGREYAIMGSTERVHFFDVTEPNEIVEVANFALGENTIWRDIKTFGQYAYAVSETNDEGLAVFDLSQLPDTVKLVNQVTDGFKNAHNVFIETTTGRLYIVGSRTANIVVYDLNEDPSQPELLAAVELPEGRYVHDVFVDGYFAYCSHGYRGLYIWDMSDPTMPIQIAKVNTGGYNHSSWITADGKYSLYAEEVPIGRPLGVIDLEKMMENEIEIALTFSEPLLAPFHTANRPHNPFIKGNYAYLSYYHDGIVIFDISDPLNPKRIAHYDTTENDDYPDNFDGVWGVYPFLPSGNIIASDVTTGLYVVKYEPKEEANFRPDATSIDPNEAYITGTTPPNNNFQQLPTTHESTTAFTVMPNPTNDWITINLNGQLNAPIHAQIHSMNGQVIQEQISANPTFQLDLSTLPKGIYILNVQKGEERYRERITKF